ncbi:MAG: putative pre-16S rRNA nuclease [Phycisphaeraceae bacterium]|nr:MAG: putative pre-16S rRNA nuclease [Phycisphaeraceae bacterium]
MRYLAIDLGDKRTGLALGDDVTGIASPAGLVEIPIDRARGDALLDALAARARADLGPADALVLGMPLNMDGSEGPRAKLVRAFALRLAALAARPVILADERKTSQAADARMAQSGLTHGQKKARRDAIAAAEILRALLEDPAARIDTIEPPTTPPEGAQSGANPPG